MRRVRKLYIDIEEGQVHGRVADGDDPAVVFLHQTASCSEAYAALMARLDLPNRLVAIDTPGFGESFHPKGWPSMRRYAGYVTAALDQLGVGAMHLFGHHTGASLAIEIAATWPERVRSVMLAGPVVMTDSERADFARQFDTPVPLRRDGGHVLTFWNYASSNNPDCDLEILHTEVVSMLRARVGRAQAYASVARHKVTPRAARVRAPVLLLSTPTDYFHATLDRAKALFPAARTQLTGGGNLPTMADPGGVARAVRRFVAQVDQP